MKKDKSKYFMLILLQHNLDIYTVDGGSKVEVLLCDCEVGRLLNGWLSAVILRPPPNSHSLSSEKKKRKRSTDFNKALVKYDHSPN
ncbi:hypothetical protein FEM48_Zijuj03G0123900 [Ziziphus jujuba var. spinosa]|uniref:Uncharacterized protein n=1 Tax=Ziziphus jujuba var. spinosa TaxID=714518 RepID=A0A978VQA5_ZIZJJ|nr:hypothetical protein FEM48_Zijuj03G0123900 [Ziziphus jujuba var. spinosa]